MHIVTSRSTTFSFLSLALVCLLAACGGGGGGGGGGGAASLQSITLSPGSIDLPFGFTLQMTATGHYSDNTTQNLTSQASWSSSDVLVATVGDSASDKGLLTGIAIGNSIITATFSGLSATRSAEVVDPVLAQIDIQPSSLQMVVGATKPFTCTAFYVGGFQRDVTEDAFWSTTDTAIATVSNSPGNGGEVTSHATGTVDLNANWSGFDDSAALTVIAVEILDADVPLSAETSAPVSSIDANGTVLSLWCYEGTDPGRVYWRKRTSGGDWSNRQQIPGLSQVSLRPKVVTNHSGVRFAAWSSESGLWVSRYDESAGWEPALEIASGTPSELYATQFELCAFENGDAWIVWQASDSEQLRFKRYTAGSGWGSTGTIGALGGSKQALALAHDYVDGLILLWQSFDAAIWTLSASRYTLSGGLEATVVLYSSTIYHQPAIDMDSVGNALAVFVDFSVFPAAHLHSARYNAGAGWDVPELVSDLDVPREPTVALDEAGGAFAFWRHATVDGTGLSGSRFVSGTGWEERVQLKSSPGGAPIPFPAHLDALGGIVAYWQTNSNTEGKRLELARFVPASGWSPIESFDFIGAEGIVQELRLALHLSGLAIVTWVEREDSGDVVYAHRF